MIRRPNAAIFLVAALLAAASLTAQQVDTSRSITTKVTKPKNERFAGEVIAANAASITVRSRENERMIRTFTYSPELRQRIQGVLDQGGWQTGDKVEVEHASGTTVALKIKGKPSKPR